LAIFAVLVIGLCVEAAAITQADDPCSHIHYGLIYRSPFIFYLVAIWMMRSAFRALAEGAVFNDVVPSLLGSTGYALSAGAVMTILPVPLALHFIFGPGASSMANFDAAAIMLGIVGMMLVLLSRLLAQAADLRAELDEFF
jgi:uncharacterized membrane protein YwaF